MADPVSLAITVAVNVAAMALSATRKIEGPRLTDLSASVADYGTPINYFMGDRRLECPCFYCEPIKEKKHKTKSKGGKYTEYKYYGTFAIIVADHHVAQYLRIWFDRHLVWDMTTGGDSLEDILREAFNLGGGHLPLSQYMRQYKGTQTAPDPRMVAYITNKEGADLTPGYLDIAYLMFEALPLEQLGNRFPQVSVEATTTTEGGGFGAFVYDELSATVDFNEPGADSPPYSGDLTAVSYNGNYVAGGYYNGVYLVSTESRPPVLQYNAPDLPSYLDLDSFEQSGFLVKAVDDEGTVWGDSSIANGCIVQIDDGIPTVQHQWYRVGGEDAENGYVLAIWTFTLPNGSIFGVVQPGAAGFGTNTQYHTFVKSSPGVVTTVDLGTISLQYAFQDDIGDVWIVCIERQLGPVDQMMLQRITDVTSGSSPYPSTQMYFNMPSVDYSQGGTYITVVTPVGTFRNGRFVGEWTFDWVFSVALDGSLNVLTRNLPTDEWLAGNFGLRLPPDPTHEFLEPYVGLDNAARRVMIDLQEDLSFGVVYVLDQWGAPDTAALSGTPYPDAGPTTVYDPLYLDAKLAFAGNRWIYVNEAANLVEGDLFVYYIPETSRLTLGSICAEVARRTGMNSDDYDFTPLDQPIYGYSWTIGPAKDIVAHLLDIHDSDIVPHGFDLIGKKRGGDIDGPEIDAAYLVRQNRDAPNSSTEPLYQIIMAAESDLPRRVFATYADANAEQQPNTAVAQRNFNSTITTRELPIDVTTLAMTPDEAQPLAERWLRRQHIGGTTYRYIAWPRELRLEPGDIRISNLDGQFMRGRLTRMVIRADRSIETEWEQDSAVAAVLKESPGAPALGRPPPTIFNPSPSRPFILDIPLVSDADDQTTPFLYVTAGRLDDTGTFPGADIQQNDTTDEDSWVSGWELVVSTDEAIWGTCENALGDALPWIPDRGNELVVSIPNGGSLESHDDEYLNANLTANLAAIGTHETGWEIVQFGEAVMQSAEVWHISNFYRRGVKGTERYMATHVPGEEFVLLQLLVKHNMGAGEIGDTDYYRSVTLALDADDDTVVEQVDYLDYPHRPLSPVHITLVRDTGTGDWQIDWVRRSRIGGGSVNGQDVPLGEASEAYRVKIMNGLTVLATYNVTSPTKLYTAAEQTTDWGSPQTSLTVQICQMDPTLNIEGTAETASA